MKNKNSHTKKDPRAELSGLGAALVEATRHTFAAKKLCEEANRLLLDAQSQVAALHKALGQSGEEPPQ